MRTWLGCALVTLGCSHAEPSPFFKKIGPRNEIRTWFENGCGLTGYQREVFVADGAKAYDDYMTEYIACSHMGALEDVTIEIRSNGQDACGVRLGPAKLTRRIDANIVLPWFADQALAERVASALATEQASLVDGMYVGMVQDTKNFTKFMLVVDGCGKIVNETGAQYSIH